MGQFSYQPAEGEVGSTPSGWTLRGDTGTWGGSVTVVNSDSGRRAIRIAGGSFGSPQCGIEWTGNGNPGSNADMRMFIRFRHRASSDAGEIGPCLRTSAVGAGAFTSYWTRARGNTDGSVLARYREFNSATVANEVDFASLSAAVGVDLLMALDVVGTAINGKIWKDGDPEPTSGPGTFSVTDSTITAASNPFILFTNYMDADVYFVGIGTGADAAPRGGGPVVAAPVITGPSGAAGAGSSTANVAENATTGPTFTTDIALGGGYPTLTGADAARWTVTPLTSTSWRLDPNPPKSFESPDDAGGNNVHDVVFNASATVSQSCAITITDVDEPPLAPTIGTATPGNASASVSFTPPDNTGRPAITNYTVTSSPGGLTGTGSTSPIVVSGLSNGTPYTFTVTATNAEGTSPPSAASNSVTPSLASGTITTLPNENLSGSLQLNSLLHYSWFPGGRVGSLTGITPQEGTVSTHASTGVASIGGATVGDGILMLAQRGSTVADDTSLIQPATSA